MEDNEVDPHSNRNPQDSGRIQLTDMQRKKILEAGRLLQELAVIDNIPYEMSLRLLGLDKVFAQTTNNLDSKSSGGVSPVKNKSTTQTPKSTKSRARAKGRSSLGSSNPNLVDGLNKNPNSSSKKRQNSVSPNRESSMKKSRKDYSDPSSRIVKVVRIEEKKKFALPFSPVLNGTRNAQGEIQESPKGGPLGLLEGAVEDFIDEKRCQRQIELCDSLENVQSLIRVLASFVATIDAGISARSLRKLTPAQVNTLWKAPLEAGLKVLQTSFNWDTSHESLTLEKLLKITPKVLQNAGFQKFRRNYLDQAERSREVRRNLDNNIGGKSTGDVMEED